MKKIKKILYFVSFILLFSCVSGSKIINTEDNIRKTKIYIGKYIYSEPNEFNTYIITEHALIVIGENPKIPDDAWCYVRIEISHWDMHPRVLYYVSKKYFTWNGAEKEYLVYNNIEQIFK